MSKTNLYVYVSPTNRKYVDTIALKNNRTRSDFIEELITAHRRKRPVSFTLKPLKSEEKLKKDKERRRKKLKELQ